MNWDNVKNIRNAQASAQARFDAEHIATQETIEKAMQSETFNALAVPRMTELESMIFKMRSELIDYIVAHGLVDGLILDGVLQPVEGGKIILTKELIETITEKLGYYKKDDVERLLSVYLPEHNYVSDADYVHTDNNYTTDEKDKLEGIETGAEVNKIIDLVFNGVSVLDNGTRVATITITPEDIKAWYESNPDTNAFTDKEKSKLAGIKDGAEVNRVDDVLVDGRSVLDDNKKAKITKEIIKSAYEANDDTNAFTDSEKQKLADLDTWKPEAQKAIDANTQGVADAKQSISELGDEVNSVAGRVTTIESNYVPYEGATKDVDLALQEIKANRFNTSQTGVSLGADGLERTSEDTGKSNSLILTTTDATFTSDSGFTPIYIGAPSHDFHATTKKYVDDETKEISDSLISLAGRVTENETDIHSAQSTASTALTAVNNLTTSVNEIRRDFVPYDGLTKNINMGNMDILDANDIQTDHAETTQLKLTSSLGTSGNGVTLVAKGSGSVARVEEHSSSTLARLQVGTPTENSDATNKKYVDDAVAGAGGGDTLVFNKVTLGSDYNDPTCTVTTDSFVWALGVANLTYNKDGVSTTEYINLEGIYKITSKGVISSMNAISSKPRMPGDSLNIIELMRSGTQWYTLTRDNITDVVINSFLLNSVVGIAPQSSIVTKARFALVTMKATAYFSSSVSGLEISAGSLPTSVTEDWSSCTITNNTTIVLSRSTVAIGSNSNRASTYIGYITIPSRGSLPCTLIDGKLYIEWQGALINANGNTFLPAGLRQNISTSNYTIQYFA